MTRVAHHGVRDAHAHRAAWKGRGMQDSRRLLVRTLNSVYEVWMKGQRFRRTSGNPAGSPPLHQWRLFHRLGPIARGRPMRLWVAHSHAGRVSHMDVLTTAPVVEVTQLDTEHSAEEAPAPNEASTPPDPETDP